MVYSRAIPAEVTRCCWNDSNKSILSTDLASTAWNNGTLERQKGYNRCCSAEVDTALVAGTEDLRGDSLARERCLDVAEPGTYSLL